MKKKITLLIFCLLFFPFSIWSQNNTSFFNSVSFGLGGYLDIRIGHQGEYVYEPLSNDRMLSYLEWDEKPLIIVGLTGEAEYKNFQLKAQGNLAIPTDSGIMIDLDYMNVSDFPDCPDSVAKILTNYSESLCHTNSLFSIQVQLSYIFNLNRVLSLAPVLGYEFQHSDQSAWGLDGFYYNRFYTESNGYYGSYDTTGHNYSVYDSQDKETLRLKRNYHLIWLGLGASFNLNKSLSLNANVLISPFTAIESLDWHLNQGQAFLDDTHSLFSGGKVSVALNYKIDLHNCIYAQVEWLSTGIADGITYSGPIGADNYYGHKNSHAGADMKTWDFVLGYKYFF
ncbi:MAG: omptin family outer membrane protease [Treponema sp.]|nr:omptin family outer membrane protease [Treponema sp.]